MSTTLTIDQALARALQLHRAGHLLDAENIYRQILKNQPQHADALHLLGMSVFHVGRHEEAQNLIQQAIAISPNQAVFHSNLGLVLAAMNNLPAAIAAYRRAVELDSTSAEAMNNLGAALHGIGETHEAELWLRQSLALRPDYVDARNNLAHILKLQGTNAVNANKMDEALRCYEQSVKLNPGNAEALHFLGSLLHESGNSPRAVELLKRSLEIFPDSAETHNNLGNALYAGGWWERSITCYRRAIQIKPDFPQACNNLGNVLKQAGEIEEAIAAYTRAVELQPKVPEPYSNLGNLLREAGQRTLAMQSYAAALQVDPHHAQTHNNLANAYCETGEWDRAIEGYNRALSIQPDYADALNNLGTALEEIGQRDRAMELYRRALDLNPGSVSAPWNIALLQLLRGQYTDGWVGYEHRWRQAKQKLSFRNFTEPMLRIDDAAAIKGQHVFLHAEQGLGDTLQFCRYAPMVADLGARVTLECPPQLLRLMRTLRGVDSVIATGSAIPHFDSQCPLMSLPMVFNTALATVPAEIPYLSADPGDVARWAARFTDQPRRLRVGLVWAGGTTHQKDRHRSLKLADLAMLAPIPGIDFYSLQVGEPAKQAASPPAGMRLIDWTSDLKDFADTAALISNLDLIITVDTAVGHLAGALGKKVWTLIAYSPDWRWLLDRQDSPWYPQTRLFRQQKPGVWDGALAAIADELVGFRVAQT